MGSQTILEFLSLILLLVLYSDLFHTTSFVPKCDAIKLKMIHRDSPESPVYRPNLTDDDKMKELIRTSRLRLQYLASLVGTRNNNNSSKKSSPHPDVVIRPSIGFEMYYYIVQVGIGTFETDPSFKTYYLTLDTASDLIWTQCEGCEKCFRQAYPYFPASGSKSYKAFNCQNCPWGMPCEHGCIASRTYASTATVQAKVASETFTFQSEGDQAAIVTGVIFGCGFDMQNFAGDDPNNKISGILGMSYGDFSLMGQPGSIAIHGGKFSYCLQSASSQGQQVAPMVLRFGADVIELEGMRSTPLYRQPNLPLYYLNLQGIGVAGQKLDIPPEVFHIKEDKTGGCFIDSGATSTFITTGAYQIFEDGVASFIESHNQNVRKIAPEQGFSFCYERYQDPDTVNLPFIELYFENGVMDIQPGIAFYVTKSSAGQGLVCMTIFKSGPEVGDSTLIGAYHQVDQRIIFDVQNGVLKFGHDDCNTGN